MSWTFSLLLLTFMYVCVYFMSTYFCRKYQVDFYDSWNLQLNIWLWVVKFECARNKVDVQNQKQPFAPLNFSFLLLAFFWYFNQTLCFIHRLHQVSAFRCLPQWDGPAWQRGYGAVAPSLWDLAHLINPVDHSHSAQWASLWSPRSSKSVRSGSLYTRLNCS